jgi:head-tail adaptor
MLSAAELADLQATAGLLMTTPCTIQRKASVSDGMGGMTDTWSTASTTVCHVAPARIDGRELVDLGRLDALNYWTIALPFDADVTVADRINALAQVYEVMGVEGPQTDELQRIAECVRVQ